MSDWAEFALRVEEALDEDELDADTVITGTVNTHRDILNVLKEFLTIGST